MDEDLKNLSDEELDQSLNNALSDGESSTDEGSSQESNNTETEESSTDEGSSQEQVEELDWLPEEFRGVYQENKEEALKKVAKSYQELSRKFGENSQYNDLIALFKANPAFYEKAVKAVMGEEERTSGETKPESPQDQDPVDQLVEKLKGAGYEDDIVGAFEQLAQMVKQQNQTVEERLAQREQQRIANEVSETNQNSFKEFLSEIPMSNDDAIKFAYNAEQVVKPTGKHGAWTTKDLKNAYAILYPDKMREQIISEYNKQLQQAANGSETTPSSQPTNAGNNTSINPKFTPQSREQAAQVAETMSDEELDAILEQGGLIQKTRKMFGF